MARMEQQRRRLYEMCAMAIVAGRADLDGASRVGFDIDLPIFSVGRAAQLADIHPQTLRQYDRSGLVVPQRTGGGARRYSLRDVDRLIQAQHMSQRDGINLTGIARILDLEEENRQLRRQLRAARADGRVSVFTADMSGRITEMRRCPRARHWRHQFQTQTRELTAGVSSDPVGVRSKSVVLWHTNHR
ncbi:heat shock protein transcriptional repressor HspR [Bifidobacterium pseudolongum]|nr:MerR family transcriptional regulator [Bifidobacterium pseudolongum]